MDNYRKQIAANLRIACPSIALGTHTTELVTTIKDGLHFACICGTSSPHAIHIMGPGRRTAFEAMEALLYMTSGLVERKLSSSIKAFSGGGARSGAGNAGMMLPSLLDEAGR